MTLTAPHRPTRSMKPHPCTRCGKKPRYAKSARVCVACRAILDVEIRERRLAAKRRTSRLRATGVCPDCRGPMQPGSHRCRACRYAFLASRPLASTMQPCPVAGCPAIIRRTARTCKDHMNVPEYKVPRPHTGGRVAAEVSEKERIRLALLKWQSECRMTPEVFQMLRTRETR